MGDEHVFDVGALSSQLAIEVVASRSDAALLHDDQHREQRLPETGDLDRSGLMSTLGASDPKGTRPCPSRGRAARHCLERATGPGGPRAAAREEQRPSSAQSTEPSIPKAEAMRRSCS